MGRLSRSHYHDVDRGWAWVVMVTTYVGMATFCNTMYMGGVIYLELLDRFNDGEAKTSLVGALNSGILCLVAPVSGIVITKWSCRVCIVAGGILTSAGFAVGAFMPSLEWMILAAGVVVGIGFSLSSAGIICVAGFYFQKWRDAVVSGAFISVGVAMFSSAPVGLYIFEHFGFVSGFLLIAGIQAHVCVVGMLCHPSSLEKQVYAQRKLVRTEKSGFRLMDYVDFSLMKDMAYLCFLISTIAWNFCLSVAIQHLPNYMRTMGGSAKDISLLMTSFSISNTIGRVLGSLTISNLEFKSVYVHTAAIGISGIITTTFPYYAKMVGGAYVFTIQLGLFCGWPGSMMTSISVKYVGVSKMSEAYGLSYLFSGIGVTAGPVLIGFIYGTTRSYENSFISAGVIQLVGAAFGCAAIWFRKTSQTREDSREITVQQHKLTQNGGSVTEMVRNGTSGVFCQHPETSEDCRMTRA